MNTGAIDVAANLLKVFKIPDTKDTSEMKIIYGNVILVKVVRMADFVGLDIIPGASTKSSSGINISTISVKNNKK